MILADENIDRHFIEALRGNGFDVLSIREEHPGVSDSHVIELARANQRIILTEDKDFGEWVYAHHVKDISVVLLRYAPRDSDHILEVLLDLLRARLESLRGSFVIVATNKVRIRTLK